MGGPDPSGLDIEERDDGSFTITAELWDHGNKRHRIARMLAVRRRILRTGWRCVHCGTQIALFRRADADFCREACRKKEARFRRTCREKQQREVDHG
jgi:hypothetical protein